METQGRENNAGRWSYILRPTQLAWKLSDTARQFKERRSLSPSAALGKRGEDLAHRYLTSAGLTVLSRNYRPAPGEAEVDIVARERDILVFVEVKSRSTDEYGSPDRAISEDKQRRITAAARSFTTKAGIPWSQVRFDVVSIVFNPSPSIVHHRDVFLHGRAR